jgi:hypothetical protein
MGLRPYAIPTSEVFDPLTQYSVGDVVGSTVAADVWGCANGAGQPIANIAPYSPTGNGPLGAAIMYRKDFAPTNQWAASQMVVPFDTPDSSVGVRVNSNGSGYFVANMTGLENGIGGSTYVYAISPAFCSPAPPTPDFIAYSDGNPATGNPTYCYNAPTQISINGEMLRSALYLFRRNADGSTTSLASFQNSAALSHMWENLDGFYCMVEAFGTDPVTIRVGVLYAYEVITPHPHDLPGGAYHFCPCFTYVDSSAGRLKTGAPGFIGGQTSAGTLYGFNAGTVYALTATAGIPEGGFATLSGLRVPGSTITVTRR